MFFLLELHTNYSVLYGTTLKILFFGWAWHISAPHRLKLSLEERNPDVGKCTVEKIESILFTIYNITLDGSKLRKTDYVGALEKEMISSLSKYKLFIHHLQQRMKILSLWWSEDKGGSDRGCRRVGARGNNIIPSWLYVTRHFNYEYIS